MVPVYTLVSLLSSRCCLYSFARISPRHCRQCVICIHAPFQSSSPVCCSYSGARFIAPCQFVYTPLPNWRNVLERLVHHPYYLLVFLFMWAFRLPELNCLHAITISGAILFSISHRITIILAFALLPSLFSEILFFGSTGI